MPDIFIYTRECHTCGETKPHSEMLQSKGKCIAKCLECQCRNNEKASATPKKLNRWLDHPWKNNRIKIWGSA
jgi:hypothetical protein